LQWEQVKDKERKKREGELRQLTILPLVRVPCAARFCRSRRFAPQPPLPHTSACIGVCPRAQPALARLRVGQASTFDAPLVLLLAGAEHLQDVPEAIYRRGGNGDQGTRIYAL